VRTPGYWIYGKASRAIVSISRQPAVRNRCAIHYSQLPALFLPSNQA
jgi:hypothetical protein